jgi:hypothetical protein
MIWKIVYLAIGALVGLSGLWLDKKYQVIHSLLFIIILMPLSIFVASSTGNTIGQGLVAALMISLWIKMLRLYRQPQQFNQRFQVTHKPLTSKEITYGVIVFGLVTVLVVVVIAFSLVSL